MYFYTESQRLLSEYDFFYKEFTVSDIITMTHSTPAIYTDDYSVITFDGIISITNEDLLPDETIGIVLYFKGVKCFYVVFSFLKFIVCF
jgi:hypothetical protein